MVNSKYRISHSEMFSRLFSACSRRVAHIHTYINKDHLYYLLILYLRNIHDKEPKQTKSNEKMFQLIRPFLTKNACDFHVFIC
jgi:hypothetical protein